MMNFTIFIVILFKFLYNYRYGSNYERKLMNAGFDELAKCIHYHRKQSNLTRIELANLAGVSKSTLFDLEHGKQTIQLDTLLKIFHALNIRISLTSPIMQAFEEQENATS